VIAIADQGGIYHKTTRAALQAMTPRFDWTVYLRTVEAGTPMVRENASRVW
jgi:hypothetical protein